MLNLIFLSFTLLMTYLKHKMISYKEVKYEVFTGSLLVNENLPSFRAALATFDKVLIFHHDGEVWQVIAFNNLAMKFVTNENVSSNVSWI